MKNCYGRHLMFGELYDELSKMQWKYHLLQSPEEGHISLTAVSMDPNGIQEVMMIKEVADKYRFHTTWDGSNIKIIEAQKGSKHF